MIRTWIAALFLALSFPCFSAESIVGFWKTVNEETHQPESIIGIYEHGGKYFGRIILTYNKSGQVSETIDSPHSQAPGVLGNPPYSGLDIIWNLQDTGKKFTNGRILDPEHGKIYDAELWVENGNLIVRGKLFIFGRNQTWPAAQDQDFPAHFKRPNLSEFIPNIPKVK